MPVPDPTELAEHYRGAEIRGIGSAGLEAARRQRDRYWSRRLLDATGPEERAAILREDHEARVRKRSNGKS